jgi:hypothetical protein
LDIKPDDGDFSSVWSSNGDTAANPKNIHSGEYNQEASGEAHVNAAEILQLRFRASTGDSPACLYTEQHSVL